MTWRPTARLFWERVSMALSPHAIAATHYPAAACGHFPASRQRGFQDAIDATGGVRRPATPSTSFLFLPREPMAPSRDTHFARVSSGARSVDLPPGPRESSHTNRL